MKKVFIVLSTGFMFFIPKVHAQFRTGTLMVGSTLGGTTYSSGTSNYGYDNGNSRSTDTKTFSLSAGPQLGVFVSPNIVVGGTLSVNVNNTKTNTTNTTVVGQGQSQSTNNGNTTTYTIGFGPFLRAYFANQPASNLFYMQIQGSLAAGGGNSSGDGGSANSTWNSSGTVSNVLNWNAGGSLGVTHFFTKHVGMDVSAGYLYSNNRSDNTNATHATPASGGATSTTTNNYTLKTTSNGINFSLGFHWFLGRY